FDEPTLVGVTMTESHTPSSVMVSVPASKRNCSKTSTCILSCACPTVSSHPIPASLPTCSSSTALAQPNGSGTTSNRYPTGAKTTPKPRLCNLKSSSHASTGGTTAKKTTTPGASTPVTYWKMEESSTSKTPVAVK